MDRNLLVIFFLENDISLIPVFNKLLHYKILKINVYFILNT